MTNIVELEYYRVSIHQDESLDYNTGLKFVASTKCGAVNCFIGIIRDTDSKIGVGLDLPIRAIVYEAYETMLVKQVLEIMQSTIKNHGHGDLVEDVSDCRAYVAIRLGRVDVGEASILIAVSSPRRHFSYRATMSILEKVKASAVMWKKIIYSDGSEQWAGSHKSEASWLRKDVSH